MSFQNYDQFQGQPPQQDPASAGAPNPTAQPEGGAAAPGMETPQSGFQSGTPGEPGSAGAPGGDMKTTLW